MHEMDIQNEQFTKHGRIYKERILDDNVSLT